ncbi:MAG TPA: hypothetical protein VIU63_09535 [Nitrospira sp.]
MPKRKRILSDYARGILALAEWLEDNPQIDMVDQVFIENHLYVAQSAYGAWKYRIAHKEKQPAGKSTTEK